MADGEINRNGATIRIDDDGGVQVEPAEGQEVEYTGPDRGTDAIRDSVNTDQIQRDGTIIEQSSSFASFSLSNSDDPDDVSSDLYVNLQNKSASSGTIPLSQIPDGATLHGLFYARPDSVPDNGAYRPQVISRGPGDSVRGHELDELEIEVSEGDGGDLLDTGPEMVEITTIDTSNFFATEFITQGRVDSGTLSSDGSNTFGLLFEWRVD